jgi:uncharacterized protein YbjT (DUF2867 family)
MYVVFGANGNTGSVVANTLLDRGKQVRVVARAASKVEAFKSRGAEVIEGNVLDAASVAAALKGAEGAYLLMPPDATADDLVGRGKKIVDTFVTALSRASVPHAVVLSSVAAQQPSGTGPIVITHYAESTLPKVATTRFTFVRAAYFMENILANTRPMKEGGVLPVFGGGGSFAFPMVATKDIGRVAADALLATPLAHEWVELSGPKEYSFDDAAEIASKTLGRAVKTQGVPIDAMVPTLTTFGFSANVAGLYREMTEAMGKGLVRFEGKGRAVRGKVTLEEVLRPALA